MTLLIIDMDFLYQFNLELIAPLFTVSFHEKFEKKMVFKIFKSWQVCDWLAKWIIMLRFMDLRWPRVFRRSNVGLVLSVGCQAMVYFDPFTCSILFFKFQEDVASLRRKLERAKKIEMASSADEVLMEEIREYKVGVNTINPLHAKFFRGNINIYLHLMSFLHTNKTQVVEIPPRVRHGPAYST